MASDEKALPLPVDGEGPPTCYPLGQATYEAQGTTIGNSLPETGLPRVAVLIPAYNEELTIASVVLQARKYVHHVLVVDDGSNDRTSEVARLAGAEVIEHTRNSGKAAALNTGFDELREKDFDIVVMMDGDGQHNVANLNALIIPILEDDADLIIGSRFLKEDNDIPIYRQIGQRILNCMISVGISRKISDSQSGFRAINRKALAQINFSSTGYAIEQDMILRCSEAGLRIREIPISVRYDVPNGHKQGPLSMGIGLFSNMFATIGHKHPMYLFGGPGMILFAFGLFLTILSLFDIHLMSNWISQLLLSSYLLTIGTVLIISALTLNSLSALVD